jgi:2-polyprenyl-3-methyl-5-hydroxy-6-metoxy-1,4-benzoquinol methylase
MKFRFLKSRDDYIVNTCKGKNILHIGAADWPYTQEKLDGGNLLYALLDNVVKSQVGIDLDKEAASLLNNKEFKNSRIEIFDMNKLNDFDVKVDVIIFGETIEHVVNPGTALENLKQVMGVNTELIITTPNAFALRNFINAIKGKEHQHFDHSVMFSYKTLVQLLGKCGLEVSDFIFTHLHDSENLNGLNWRGKIDHKIQVFFAKRYPLLAPAMVVKVKLKEI